MIYDYIDMPSKVGVAAVAAKWLGVAGNVETMRNFCQQYNIFNEIIVVSRQQGEKDLWQLLQLIGAGAIVPLFNKETKSINMGVRQNWQFPRWVFNTVAWSNLNLHVEQILEARDSMKAHFARPLILSAALDRFNQQQFLVSAPKAPHVDVDKDRALIRELRSSTGKFQKEWRKRLWKNTSAH